MLLVIFDYVRAKIKIKNMGHQEQASKWGFSCRIFISSFVLLTLRFTHLFRISQPPPSQTHTHRFIFSLHTHTAFQVWMKGHLADKTDCNKGTTVIFPFAMVRLPNYIKISDISMFTFMVRVYQHYRSVCVLRLHLNALQKHGWRSNPQRSRV